MYLPLASTTSTAEAYYTADYPEDEVDSDDENNLGAYKYRNNNASDEEEYLSEYEAESDNEALHEGDLDEETLLKKIRIFNQRIRSRGPAQEP